MGKDKVIKETALSIKINRKEVEFYSRFAWIFFSIGIALIVAGFLALCLA